MSDMNMTTDVNVFAASDGRLIAHAPLHGQAFFVEPDMASLIGALKSDPAGIDKEREAKSLDALRKAGLVGEFRTLQPSTPVIDAFTPVEATLIFTESCNLGCTYCYASSLPIKSKTLPRDLIRAAVDLVSENASKTDRKMASFRYIGGGEPTIEWELLKYATDYASQVTSKVGVGRFVRLITNGTLLDQERVGWLAKNVDFVTLSFDILPDLQVNRSYASGQDSHSKLVATVKQLIGEGIKFHLRTTISAASSSRLVEMVEYAYDAFGPVDIRFEPMSEVGRSIAEQVAKPAQQEFIDSFKVAYHRGNELGVGVTCKQFSNLKRKSSRFCDAEFTVTPDGAVSGCHRYSREEHEGYDVFRVGEYRDGAFAFDLDRLNGLRGIDVHSFSDCEKCIARWNCASGCLSARMKGGSVSEHGPLCHLTRELLKFSIEETMRSDRHER